MIRLGLLSCLCVAVLAQYNQYGGGGGGGGQAPAPQQYLTTPRGALHPPASVHYVNIGSELDNYKFGYDTGKGPLGQSFREETRLPDGTVKGAYGYLDEQGRQRIVRYSAGKGGFSAEGDVGPEGAPKASAPGPAPQPQAAPVYQQQQPAPQAYRPPPQQYNPPPQQQQQYRPPPQQYRPPQQQQQQYRPQSKDYEDYSDNGPAYIDTALLTYNIGTKQG